MIRLRVRNKLFRIVGISFVFVCIASIVVAFFFAPQLSFLQRQGDGEPPSGDSAFAFSVAVEPDHVHVGDVFVLTLRIAYRGDRVQMKEMPAESVLQSGSLDILAGSEITSVKDGVTYEEYRYELQALNVLPGGRYAMKFTPLQYRQGGVDMVFILPDKTVDIVPRFLPDADPALTPPYGKMPTYGRFWEWGMRALAVLSLLAGLIRLFVRIKGKSKAHVLMPIDDLFLRFKSIGREELGDSRRILGELEDIAVSLAALHKVTAVQLWQGEYPAHTQVPNPWEELWRLIANAYDVVVYKQQAERAYALLDALFAHYKGAQERR